MSQLSRQSPYKRARPQDQTRQPFAARTACSGAVPPRVPQPRCSDAAPNWSPHRNPSAVRAS
eukprot:1254724-Alexandrium_andersonii.AAC.1